MATLEQAREALGELLIMGFQGLELSDDASAFISQAGIGGVIINTLNYDSPAQMAELANQIQECRKKLPLWIGVDHEGGKVQRLKKGFTRIPDAAAIGATDSPKLAFEIGEVMAKELKAVGVNLNFAPVADIATHSRGTALASRTYGSDEDIVSKITSGIVRGHLVHGVQPCVKHFPGHGDTGTDSHNALPRVETTLETMRERELRPFTKAFKSRCAMVMTAHVVYTKIDPQYPATLSRRTLRELLRGELRYSRVIISDEMEMKAITDHFSAEDAPRMALEAGCDLLLYKSEAGARHAYTSLLKALEAGTLAPAVVLEAHARVISHKKAVLQPYHPASIADVGTRVGTAEHGELMSKVPQEPAKRS